jgi:hypothetical protein
MRAIQTGCLPNFGALAQLGERNTGSVEVSGSIPLSSTKISLLIKEKQKSRLERVGFFAF